MKSPPDRVTKTFWVEWGISVLATSMTCLRMSPFTRTRSPTSMAACCPLAFFTVGKVPSATRPRNFVMPRMGPRPRVDNGTVLFYEDKAFFPNACPHGYTVKP